MHGPGTLTALLKQLTEGDLTAALPVFDILDEEDDGRRFFLLDALRDLKTNASKGGGFPYSMEESQESPDLLDRHSKYLAWDRFVARVRDEFWLEISGRSLADEVLNLIELVDPPAQHALAAACRERGREWPEEFDPFYIGTPFGAGDEGYPDPDAMPADPLTGSPTEDAT